MKKPLFVALLVVLLTFSSVSAFERDAPTLPVISKPLSKLEGAIGWMKTPSGGWISRENRIPKHMSSDYDILQDSDNYSLGVDNFQLLELREVSLGDKTYYLLLKHTQGGAFEYPTIKRGWYYNYQVRGYVFEITEMPHLALDDKEPVLVEMKLVAKPSKVYYNDRYWNDYVHDIALKINEVMAKESNFDEYLVFNIIKISDAVRFVMLEKSIYKSGNYANATYHGLSVLPDLPLKTEQAITSDVFKNYYFELAYNDFMDFWNR